MHISHATVIVRFHPKYLRTLIFVMFSIHAVTKFVSYLLTHIAAHIDGVSCHMISMSFLSQGRPWTVCFVWGLDTSRMWQGASGLLRQLLLSVPPDQQLALMRAPMERIDVRLGWGNNEPSHPHATTTPLPDNGLGHKGHPPGQSTGCHHGQCFDLGVPDIVAAWLWCGRLREIGALLHALVKQDSAFHDDATTSIQLCLIFVLSNQFPRVLQFVCAWSSASLLYDSTCRFYIQCHRIARNGRLL
jgi:hypothetical protein